MRPSIHVSRDPEELAQAALTAVLALCHEAIQARGRFTLALSGGSTPRRLHALLAAQKQLPFSRMHFFFGDERHVPSDHPDSNFRMAQETLFSLAPIPPENIHRIPTEHPVEEAARLYQTTLAEFFRPEPLKFPRLDLALLGLGTDGHTASLFPQNAAVQETARWVVGTYVEKLNVHRITLTLPVLNATRAALFLVQGADKAEAAHAVLEEQGPLADRPARGVKPEPGGLLWFLDRPAASRLQVG